MTDPIPDEAVEAAARAAREAWQMTACTDDNGVVWPAVARAALTAAASHIAAQATADLRAGIEAVRDEWRARAASLRAVDSYAATLCDEHADALDAWRAGGGA